ncbi:MAG: DUF2283 domain-containing protein [Oscillatoriales cyanobacterium]|jgi:uncharacterized protein YuzE|nr:MAG: DUF2283 domain-containing protein [Oscillatoriales cyanobacterium]
MKILHDPDLNAITLIFSQDPIETSEETAPGIIIDYTEHGQIVSIEILDASDRLPLPQLLASISAS